MESEGGVIEATEAGEGDGGEIFLAAVGKEVVDGGGEGEEEETDGVGKVGGAAEGGEDERLVGWGGDEGDGDAAEGQEGDHVAGA